MSKKIPLILAIISIIIIVLGFVSAKPIGESVINQVTPSSNVTVDGTDVTDIFQIAGVFGGMALSILIIIGSFLLVITIWIIYGITLIIISIIKWINNKNNNKSNNENKVEQ